MRFHVHVAFCQFTEVAVLQPGMSFKRYTAVPHVSFCNITGESLTVMYFLGNPCVHVHMYMYMYMYVYKYIHVCTMRICWEKFWLM